MKKGIRRILSGLLCAGVLALGIPAPSRALTLTAVNDSILPLSDSTMPARLGGEVYVPYSVFSQLGVSASSSDGVLDLSANGETLSFSPAEGYVYDQNLNSYSTPAYSMNGTTYVPVKLCCGKFGLSYSTLAVAGCRKPYAEVGGEMLGTFVQISARTSLPPTEIYERAKRIDAEMKRSMSIFDEGSLLSRINRGETDIADNHIKFNLELAGRVNAVSGGAYDVTVKPLVEAYGFAGKDRSRRVNVDSIMRFVGFDKVRVEGDRLIKADPRVQLDFNSIAKGYTVDLVARMLEEEGVKDYLAARCAAAAATPKAGRGAWAWRPRSKATTYPAATCSR